jgi:hypothetical protein
MVMVVLSLAHQGKVLMAVTMVRVLAVVAALELLVKPQHPIELLAELAVMDFHQQSLDPA